MAARLLSRSKTLTLARIFHPSSPIDPLPATSEFLRSLHSLTSQRLLGSLDLGKVRPPDSKSMPSAFIRRADLLSAPPGKIWGYEQSFSRWYCGKAHGGCGTHHMEKSSSMLHSAGKESMAKTVGRTESEGGEGDGKMVTCFSPLEASITSKRTSGLGIESLKIKRTELSQKITYALIPALLVISKSSLTTSLLIFSVYWQVYGFFKEIFLDYVHQEVTRKWVLIYFKLLLFILVKDTILDFGLV